MGEARTIPLARLAGQPPPSFAPAGLSCGPTRITHKVKSALSHNVESHKLDQIPQALKAMPRPVVI